MKKAIVALASAVLFSAPCLANWQVNFNNGTYTGTVTYGGASVSSTESVPIGSASGGPLSVVAQAIYSAQGSLQQAFASYVASTVAQSNASGISTSFNGISMKGALNASIQGLTGSYAGYNQISFGGLSLSTTVSASTSWYGVSVSCSTGISVNNVQLAATYQPWTGSVLNDPAVTYAHLNPSTSTSCSSNLDFIPFLGTLLDNYAADRINAGIQGQLGSFNSKFVSAILPYGPSYLGINAALTPGKYVINGVDWGAYVINNFAGLFTGRKLSISTGLFVSPTTTTSSSATEPRPVTIVIPTLVVDFSDASMNLKFSITETDNYDWLYYCPGTKCTRPW